MDVQGSPNYLSRPLFPVTAVPDGFGGMLRDARVARRWSQERLALRSGLDRRTVGRLERGAPPTADSVFRLAHALELDPWELVPGWPEWHQVDVPGVGPRTRKRRRELGLSLAAVAAAAGVSDATLSRRERGVSGDDWPDALLSRLAVALGFADADAYRRYCSGLDGA